MTETVPIETLSSVPVTAVEPRFVTCRIGGRLYGVPLDVAGDMMVLSSLTSIPFAPAIVRGAVNVNGRMTTVIDARAALGLPPSASGSIIGLTVEHGGYVYVVSVDEVGDIAGAHDGTEPVHPLDVGTMVAAG